MKNLVICGTSGVGKTFLEEYLESQNLSYQLPKYFDRRWRPKERKDKNISLGRKEWLKLKKEFFFTLTYNGCHYGWKKADLPQNKMATLSVALKDLGRFLKANPNFLPVLLLVQKSNLELLEKRMKKRGDSKKEIEKRLKLAQKEMKKSNDYQKIVKEKRGWVIVVKNNETIFKELIPKIKAPAHS